MKQTVDLRLTLSVTQQRVLGDNPGRRYALLVNDGTDDIYLGMGIPAVANRGIRVNNGGGNSKTGGESLPKPKYAQEHIVSQLWDGRAYTVEYNRYEAFSYHLAIASAILHLHARF